VNAQALGVPEIFNAAAFFVDRHIDEGRGDRIAIECGEERVSYLQLYERVNRFGSALKFGLGVRPEERVLLLLNDSPLFAYAFFGAIKSGAVPVPLNTLWKAPEYAYVFDDSRASVLVVGSDLLPQINRLPRQLVRKLRHVVVAGAAAHDLADGFLPFDALMSDGSAELTAEPTSRDAMAFWLYSSGSTGVPKGCVHLQHDMVVCAELYAKRVLGIQPDDRCFSVAKLFFAYGLGNALYFPLAVGATSILWGGPPAADRIYAIIESRRPTLFYSVPTGFAMLLACRREGRDFDLSSVRQAVSAGEALPPALFERFRDRFGIEILDAIGSTEALHMFIANRPGAARPGSSGVVIDGYEARLLDEEGRPVQTGDIGNLWIKGDSVCASYWNQHEKSKSTIQGEWLRTGDKYSRDADGYFWYAGRSDDMLKVGGQWVSPVEVENALIGHPAVLECGVVGCEDLDSLLKPIAFVVLREGHGGSDDLAAELQGFVRERLAEYKRPRWVRFVKELPKTATGKIQRFRLREMAG
jgi:benzoate-CoA ligase